MRSVWELLAGADVMLPQAPFDPIGMMGVVQEISANRERAINEFVLTGMKLSGVLAQFRVDGGKTFDRVPWPEDTVMWSDADEARLAPVLRRAIAEFASRLSTEAANTDVVATWPRPGGPRLVASFSPGTTRTELEETRSKTDFYTDAFLAAEDVGSTPSPDNLRGTVSAAALSRYARDRAQYKAELREYRRLQRELDELQRLTLRLTVHIRNEGDRRADDVTVRLLFPPGVTVVPSGSEPFGPNTLPDLPPPSAYEDPATRRAHVMPRFRPSYREQGRTSDYEATERITVASDGRTTVSYERRHSVTPEVWSTVYVLVRFPSYEAIRPFTFDVEMETPDGVVVRSPLRVNATLAR